MIKDKNITEIAGYALIEKLMNRDVIGIDGLERKTISAFPSTYNPYKINNQYLSVFKLKFKNNSNQIKTFSSKSLVFNNGEEQLTPFNNSFYDDIYKDNEEALRMIHRLNLPEYFTIPPGQSIVKFIAIPSLNNKDTTLIASTIYNNKLSNYNYSVKVESKQKKIIKKEIIFEAEKSFKLGVVSRYYFVIVTKDSRVYTLMDNTIYLPEEIMNQEINVYGLASVPIGFATDKILNLKLNNSTENIYKLKFENIVKRKVR